MTAQQRTDDWLKERLGFVTASRVADVLAVGRSGEATTRFNYKWDLITQRLTNQIQESYQNDAMLWGVEKEPIARIAYETKTGLFVEEVGFIKHPTINWVGCSPDGLVNEGGLEIKCPNSQTHLQTINAKKAPAKYIPQIQMSMWVTNRAWWDFVSFDPRLPEELQYFCIRVPRDDEYINDMEQKVVQFLNEVDYEINNLRSKNA